MADGTARASELFRRRKAASLRLGLGEIEGGEAAGRHCQCSTCARPALSRYPQRTATGHSFTFESVKNNQLLSKWWVQWWSWRTQHPGFPGSGRGNVDYTTPTTNMTTSPYDRGCYACAPPPLRSTQEESGGLVGGNKDNAQLVFLEVSIRIDIFGGPWLYATGKFSVTLPPVGRTNTSDGIHTAFNKVNEDISVRLMVLSGEGSGSLKRLDRRQSSSQRLPSRFTPLLCRRCQL